MGRRPYFGELGKTGIEWHSGYVTDEFLHSLQGSNGIKVYREMSDNDPIVGSFLFAIKQIIREIRWTVKPYGDDSNENKKDADFLDNCMASMTHTWTDFISNVLSMLIYGWSWFEIVYERRDDDKIGWKKLAPRNATSLEKWDIAPNGELFGMIQRPAPSYTEVHLPIYKSIHFRTESAGNNPEGRSVLRNAYRSWWFKKNLEEIEAIGMERDLVGLPILKLPVGLNLDSEVPEDVAKIASAKKLISSIRRDEQEGVLLPDGWELSLLESPGSKQFNTTEVINRYSKQMAVTVLAQFIMLGMERTGSYALAESQTDMFYLCLEGWANSISSVLNKQTVPKLFMMNGDMKKELPSIVHAPIHHFKLKDMSEFISKLVGADAIEIDNEVRGYLKKYARLSEFSEGRK